MKVIYEQCSQVDRGRTFTGVSLTVDDWHSLNERALVDTLLAKGREAGVEWCAKLPGGLHRTFGGVYVSINARNVRWNPVFESTWTVDGKWQPNKNEIAKLAQEEIDAAAEKQRLEVERRRRAEQAEAMNKLLNERKQTALTDCGSTPKLSGGPWLPSTYSVAANDEVRRTGFFCVKTVEYISPAPNPFGGNAARARFIGYRDGDYQPRSEVRDFPY